MRGDRWALLWLRGVLALLVGLASSQYALRDPRSQALPLGFWAASELCRVHDTSSAPAQNPTPQPHCPLCIIGGFSDGVGALAEPEAPEGYLLGRLAPALPAPPHLAPLYRLFSRAPPHWA